MKRLAVASVAILFFIATPALRAQTPVSVLQDSTVLHDHYLFNESYQYDQQDYVGLPHMFYFANANTQPPSGTRRQRCALGHISGAPYNHADFDWFNYPDYSPADGAFAYAPPGEYLASELFGPNGFGSPSGFDFVGEFGGAVTSPTDPSSGSYYVEAAYFTDRECSDAGTEYGWSRLPASFGGDQGVDSVTFYYSDFTNCNIDFMCWDVNGQQIFQPTATATITGIPANAQGNRQYRFRIIRSDPYFVISILDTNSGGVISGCSVSISVSGIGNSSASGACQFWVPIAGWYPSVAVTQSGYVVAASQCSHVYPPPVGSPQGNGGVPPTNLPSLIGLNAVSFQVLYQ
jgi:hypothetical protein